MYYKTRTTTMRFHSRTGLLWASIFQVLAMYFYRSTVSASPQLMELETNDSRPSKTELDWTFCAIPRFKIFCGLFGESGDGLDIMTLAPKTTGFDSRDQLSTIFRRCEVKEIVCITTASSYGMRIPKRHNACHRCTDDGNTKIVGIRNLAIRYIRR